MNIIKLVYSQLIVILLLLLISFGCSNASENNVLKTLKSPNGIYRLDCVLETSKADPKGYYSIIFKIYNANGKLLFEKNTYVSHFHRWDVKWLTDEKIYLESSDIGNTYWIKKTNDDWYKVPANYYLSPNGSLAVCCDEGIGNKIVISLGIVENLDGPELSILYNKPASITVDNIFNCVKWVSDDLVHIEIIEGEQIDTKVNAGGREIKIKTVNTTKMPRKN